MTEPSLILGGGNWAGKSGNLLAYHKVEGNFYADDLTFTRASTGTIVNADGLIEEVPYNKLTYSEDFSQSNWQKTGLTVNTNQILSPDGSLNADEINITAANAHYLFDTISVSESTNYVLTFYAKKGTATDASYSVLNATNFTNIVNTTPYFNQVSDTEWTRISVNFTTPSGCTSVRPYPLRDGSSIGTIYLWGAQLNSGSTAKTYFPTTTRLNIPRVSYLNNANGSLLLEGQRTNLITYSEAFDDSDWVKYGSASVVANQAVSPDGTSNADLLNVRSTNVIRQSVTLTASTTYSCSFFAKKTNYNIIGIQTLVSGSGVQSFFNLDTGVVSTQGSGHTASIKEYSNGWYRCIVSFNCGASTSNIFDFLTDSTSLKGFYIYGAQLEQGSYPTSYIPTSGATVTRLQDASSTTGLSDVIGQTEGTMFFEIDFIDIGSVQVLLSVHDGASNKRLEIWANGSVVNGFIGGSVNIAIGNTTISEGRHKLAVAYNQSGDQAFYVDGVQVGTSSTAYTIAALTQLSYSTYNGSLAANGSVNQVQLYKTRLTDTELATLTTL